MTIRANWNTGDSFTATDANTLAAQVNANTDNVTTAVANAGAALAAVAGFSEFSSVPASAGATGVPGQWAAESGFLYICVATDTWERVAIATWP